MSHAKSTVSAALVVAATAGLAAGCQTTDPYTGEMKTSSATFGALIGAGTGAVPVVETTASSSSVRPSGAGSGHAQTANTIGSPVRSSHRPPRS